jgi:hypothetical protein
MTSFLEAIIKARRQRQKGQPATRQPCANALVGAQFLIDCRTTLWAWPQLPGQFFGLSLANASREQTLTSHCAESIFLIK